MKGEQEKRRKYRKHNSERSESDWIEPQLYIRMLASSGYMTLVQIQDLFLHSQYLYCLSNNIKEDDDNGTMF